MSFWPTEVAGAGVNKLAVAGKNLRTGSTVIVIWEFEPPDEGEVGLQVPIKSRTNVYDESTPGRDTVWVMFQRHGTPSAMYVQFWDSKDMYSLDVETGHLELVLSPTAGNGAEVEPALAYAYVDRRSFRHKEHGYGYMFSPGKYKKDLQALLLFDHDEDGTIDAHFPVSGEQFNEMGLGDGKLYVEFY